MKKILLLILPFFITGCINYTELNELSIVNGLSILKSDDDYTVYFSIIEPSKDDGLVEYSIKVLKENGKSLDIIFDSIKNKTTKKLIYSQLEIITVNEDLVNNNFREVTTFLFYLKGNRRDFPIVLLESDNYEDLLKEDGLNTIFNLLETNKNKYNKTNYLSLEKIYSDINNNSLVLIPKIKDERELFIVGLAEVNYE